MPPGLRLQHPAPAVSVEEITSDEHPDQDPQTPANVPAIAL